MPNGHYNLKSMPVYNSTDVFVLINNSLRVQTSGVDLALTGWLNFRLDMIGCCSYFQDFNSVLFTQYKYWVIL